MSKEQANLDKEYYGKIIKTLNARINGLVDLVKHFQDTGSSAQRRADQYEEENIQLRENVSELNLGNEYLIRERDKFERWAEEREGDYLKLINDTSRTISERKKEAESYRDLYNELKEAVIEQRNNILNLNMDYNKISSPVLVISTVKSIKNVVKSIKEDSNMWEEFNAKNFELAEKYRKELRRLKDRLRRAVKEDSYIVLSSLLDDHQEAEKNRKKK